MNNEGNFDKVFAKLLSRRIALIYIVIRNEWDSLKKPEFLYPEIVILLCAYYKKTVKLRFGRVLDLSLNS